MTDKENCWKLVPLERSYDMRAQAIIAFNTATANGADRDDALQAAWEAEVHASPAAAESNNAVVYPPDGTASPFTVINLGMGQVQMGDCIHDKRLPALWFGKEGKGIGHEEVLNREAKDGETIAVVTFANAEGLDVLLNVIHRIRRESFLTAPAPAAQAESSRVSIDRHYLNQTTRLLRIITGHDSGANLRETYGEDWWKKVDALRNNLEQQSTTPADAASEPDKRGGHD